MKNQIQVTIITPGKGSVTTYHDNDRSANQRIREWLEWLEKCPRVNTRIEVREII